ncbi:hypothetical protein ACSHXN_44235 (plasmid) [Streptomyces sp. HUAS TT11]|uniref:hypothetical protein n=1 Tax=Streptomyces sp. HUAS TT11 TaxID=3447508 RepID=UPI003F65E2C3
MSQYMVFTSSSHPFCGKERPAQYDPVVMRVTAPPVQQHAYPLVWRGEYLVPTGETTTTALWWIALPGQVEQCYDTSEAERLVSGICLAVGIIWEPVAAPGGATQLAEALARTEQRR